LVEEKFHSNSYRGLLLTELGRDQANFVSETTEISEKPLSESLNLPDDIFEDIIGHDEIKELLKATLLLKSLCTCYWQDHRRSPNHCLLWDIELVGGEQAVWLLGSATSKAGLWDLVAERTPRILLIDELDKMNASDTAALLSLMEGGRLVRAKKGRALDVTISIKVIAATNQVTKLSPGLKSRFAIRKLQAYDTEQYRTVVKGVLIRRENVNPDLAEEIAGKLGGKTQDVRDALRVARLSPQLGVDKAIRSLLA
jgi:Holliday junction DNA helicase RuvB